MKKNLKVHYFQHIAGEGFGSCYDFLRQHQAQISATEFFALPFNLPVDLEALPDIDDVDLLIVMGGKMSVNDEALYPWLKVEKQWIRRYISAGKPAIGLCLGGQLIANALGAEVKPNHHQELGWTTVYRSRTVPKDCFALPAQFEVMQWHRETFEIPHGAIQLAENPVCANQMYQVGKNVLGFQFHPEITPNTLRLFLDDDEELSIFNGDYIQSAIHLKKSVSEQFVVGNSILNEAIQYVLRS